MDTDKNKYSSICGQYSHLVFVARVERIIACPSKLNIIRSVAKHIQKDYSILFTIIAVTMENSFVLKTSCGKIFAEIKNVCRTDTLCQFGNVSMSLIDKILIFYSLELH